VTKVGKNLKLEGLKLQLSLLRGRGSAELEEKFGTYGGE
jgi:hypothetical protein